MLPDPKSEPRIRDHELLCGLHFEWRECSLCLSVGWERDPQHSERRMWIGLSLHHVLKHPRDDVRGNLLMLCGDGVRGCHGRIEAHDHNTLRRLGEHIRSRRHDIIEHLEWRLGTEAAAEWLRQLGLDS